MTRIKKHISKAKLPFYPPCEVKCGLQNGVSTTASRVTPPADEKGAEVEGAEETGGVIVSIHGRFSRSWASLHLMVVASMAHITVNKETRDRR